MQHLVVLDYNTHSVLFFKASNEVEINEDYIRNHLNLNPDECVWMISNSGINLQFNNNYDLQ